MPLPLSHPAVEGEVDAEFTIVILWVRKSVKHCGTQKVDAHGRVSLVSNTREPPYNRQPIERFINGFHAKAKICVRVRAHQTVASASGLFAFPGKQQTRSRLTHTGFHALIRRIFAAALQCDFNTRGFADAHEVFRDKLLLAQLSSDYFE